jgi:predicted transposase/invertase (TIGR01784 family)
MPPAPHDALFKATFSQPQQAAEALRHALPPEVVRLLDFRTLELEPGSFIDDELRPHYTDLLFSVRYAGLPIKLYLLFEHMSTPEPTMPLRLLGYMVDGWRSFLAEEPRPRWLPVILPVVLHHSDGGWRADTSFEGLFGPDVPAALRPFIPHFRFALDDLSTISDEALLARAISATSRLTLSALKHARSAADLMPFVPSWTRLVRDLLREPNGVRALQLVFRYLCEVRGTGELPVLRQITADAADEADMQTIAEMFEERGWEKGRQEGRQEGLLVGERNLLLRMLRRRFGEVTPVALARITTADQPALERWAEQLLTAATLDEVFVPG